MKIIEDFPPNIEEIRLRLTPSPSAVFTYGDRLYNPSKGQITPDLLVHEATHSIQQKMTEAGASIWWREYLKNPKFRLEQELEAYRNQYQAFCGATKDKNARAKFLWYISETLSSEMYGNIISHSEAMRLIKHPEWSTKNIEVSQLPNS